MATMLMVAAMRLLSSAIDINANFYYSNLHCFQKLGGSYASEADVDITQHNRRVCGGVMARETALRFNKESHPLPARFGGIRNADGTRGGIGLWKASERECKDGAHIHGFPLPERRSVKFRKCVPITGIIEP
ncbi:hypothetical protein RR46_04532 [Papilio xuthus]|uniref:Secreted protein n=1 Tax=Papilio xuthus TaxID=66420 RepID=A0A194PNZ1_PAPXU|nr:hypothetical protein RR46_04532 [Papilio xuthus]